MSASIARAHRALATVLAALVLLQAVVAGQALFGDWSIRLHGIMGNASFALGVVLVVLALVARLDRTQVVAAGALALALFAQVGLGYVGRTKLGAASWHIPLGVTIFGLSIFIVTAAHLRSPTTPQR